MKIKKASEQTGISCNTIRFYEKMGLLKPIRDEINGYRVYGKKDINKLHIIVNLRELDLSLDEIKLVLDDESSIKQVLESQLKKADDSIENSNNIKELCSKLLIKDEIKLDDLKQSRDFGLNTGSTVLGADLFKMLPEEIKLKYYEAIIKNGTLDELVLEDLSSYISDILYQSFLNEKLIKKVISHSTENTKRQIIKMLKEHDFELYDKINRYVYDIEDLLHITTIQLKDVLQSISRTEFLIALKAVSPSLKERLVCLYDDPSITGDLEQMGPIPLSEVIEVHEKLLLGVNALM